MAWPPGIGPYLNKYSITAEYEIAPHLRARCFNETNVTGRDLKSLGLTFEGLILEHLRPYHLTPMYAFAWVLLKTYVHDYYT